MARLRQIPKRMRGVRNVRNVTKAMQTVASVRFRRAHDLNVAFTPYTAHLVKVLGDVVSRAEAGEMNLPLVDAAAGASRHLLLVLTSNRGLCGSYNSAVVDLACERIGQFRQAEQEVELRVVGQRGARYLRFHGATVDRAYEDVGELADERLAMELAEEIMREFVDGRFGSVEVAYMQFLRSGRQKPAIGVLLPLRDFLASLPKPPEAQRPLWDCYPPARDILARLLPAAVRTRVYQAFLDAGASEHAMRLAAMRAATDNADTVAHTLKVRYNRIRQMQITTELAEIMGGRVGLE